MQQTFYKMLTDDDIANLDLKKQRNVLYQLGCTKKAIMLLKNKDDLLLTLEVLKTPIFEHKKVHNLHYWLPAIWKAATLLAKVFTRKCFWWAANGACFVETAWDLVQRTYPHINVRYAKTSFTHDRSPLKIAKEIVKRCVMIEKLQEQCKQTRNLEVGMNLVVLTSTGIFQGVVRGQLTSQIFEVVDGNKKVWVSDCSLYAQSEAQQQPVAA